MTRAAKRWVLAHSLLASLLLHGMLFGGALGWMRWRESRLDRSIEIDLSGHSLLARPAVAVGGSPAFRPPEPWVLASGRRFAPPPKAEPVSPSAQVLPESAGPPCPPPCPENPGDWAPAAATSRQPSGFESLVREEDYSSALVRSGRSGQADVELLIDASGRIRQVSILRTSHPELNSVLTQRLLNAHIQPAYDANGDPVACRLRFSFMLQLD